MTDLRFLVDTISCLDIEDLDLSATLLNTRQDIADICFPLHKLYILRLMAL